MKNNMWRFPGNNYASETGLDTSDMETFKKDPISSLARELCQNSIDARLDMEKPVLIEFNLFSINHNEIPGKERLIKEISSCEVEWAYHNKISEQLKNMHKSIDKNKIDCLRVSDFNTKGLQGVSTDEKKPWYLLTKGSGISDKSGTSGGSKGIGKYATFVASEFNTVFYNTLTIDDEVGYQGICKLCSTTVDGSDEKTQGIGYYGSDDRNRPILKSFSLDSNYKRKQTGTDIYIVGFRQETSWIKDIITKVLDSFMSAIMMNDLIVKVLDITLSSDTLENIIYNDNYILKSAQKDIIAQYTLLSDISIYRETFDVSGYGEVELLVKGYSKDEINMATNNCVMVRYPYMKIKTINNVSQIPCSAMCIIKDNHLNEMLRDLENPQHTDWEIKRITDSAKRSEIRAVIKNLYKQIVDIIREFLASSENTQTDVEGASDYLPESGDNEFGDKKMIIAETAEIVKPKKNKTKDKVGYVEDDDAESLEPDIGSLAEGNGAPKPYGENQGSNGEPKDSDEEGEVNEGDSDILKYVLLSGIKYRFFVINKEKAKYGLIFVAPSDEEDCDLKLSYIDNGGNKYPVKIFHCLLNNSECDIQNNEKVIFSIFKDKKYHFEFITDQDDLFACEVKLYARR